MAVNEWTERLIDEHAELVKRLQRLAIFKSGKEFAAMTTAKRRRLNQQEFHMRAYARILAKRIATARWV